MKKEFNSSEFRKINREKQKDIVGSGGRLELCNDDLPPVACKPGHCVQYPDGSWGCL